jgi:hypothetical protein
MILVEKNNTNEIAFTAVDNKSLGSGVYKLIFKSSVTKQEKWVIPTVLVDNDRYLLLEFTESDTEDPTNGTLALRGGFYPNGEYTYELWETNTASGYDDINLIEKGEMKLLGENVCPEINYFFFGGNNPATDAFVYVTPCSDPPTIRYWNTTPTQWQLDEDLWENA